MHCLCGSLPCRLQSLAPMAPGRKEVDHHDGVVPQRQVKVGVRHRLGDVQVLVPLGSGFRAEREARRAHVSGTVCMGEAAGTKKQHGWLQQDSKRVHGTAYCARIASFVPPSCCVHMLSRLQAACLCMHADAPVYATVHRHAHTGKSPLQWLFKLQAALTSAGLHPPAARHHTLALTCACPQCPPPCAPSLHPLAPCALSWSRSCVSAHPTGS